VVVCFRRDNGIGKINGEKMVSVPLTFSYAEICPDEESQENPAAPLKDTFRSLKMKYVELQEKCKLEIKVLDEQMDDLRKENGVLVRKNDALLADNQQLNGNISQLRGTASLRRTTSCY